MLWEELSTWDFEAAVKKSEGLCVLPIGVLEKHGDHLPLATDMYIATAVAKKASEQTNAVVFPYYFLGQIAEARHVKGTIAASHRLIMDALLEMCDEIHRNGFTKILLLSGHGGNGHFLPFFAQQFPGINRPYAFYTYYVHTMIQSQYSEVKDRWGFDHLSGHAGFSETSLMMHLRPDLVHIERAKVSQSDDMERLEHIKGQDVFTGFNWYASYPHHFAGDPTGAAGEHGAIIFDMIVSNAVSVINSIKADAMSPKLINEYNKLAN
jgi:creatinine amidohydrolase